MCSLQIHMGLENHVFLGLQNQGDVKMPVWQEMSCRYYCTELGFVIKRYFFYHFLKSYRTSKVDCRFPTIMSNFFCLELGYISWFKPNLNKIELDSSFLIPVTSNQNYYMGDFLESLIWSSMDHSKDNFRNNYLIFKLNYFISFLIIISRLF